MSGVDDVLNALLNMIYMAGSGYTLAVSTLRDVSYASDHVCMCASKRCVPVATKVLLGYQCITETKELLCYKTTIMT